MRRAVDHVIVTRSTPTFARLLSPSKWVWHESHFILVKSFQTRMVEIGGDLISHCESRGGDVTKVGKSVEPNEEGRGDGAQAGRCRIARHWYTVVFEAGSSRIGKRCEEYSGIKVTESYCNPFQSHSKMCSSPSPQLPPE